MKDGREVFVQMGNELVLAKEYDLSVKVEGISIKEFLQVWDVETLQRLLDSAIKNEEYENASLIRDIILDQTP